MKKSICFFLIILFFNSSFVIQNSAFASEYRLGPYDTIEFGVVNHPELAIKQTISPDGQASLPLLGVVSAEGHTLKDFQKLLTDSYSAYIDNPQITINLTPKPIYVVQYDLKKDTWEVKMAKSADEARAYADLDPALTIENGNVYKVTMGARPDFWDSNWYKVITATAVLVGINSALHK